jgi:hypothetical protein
MNFMSTLKGNCENYLFEDYHLKSGISIWIFTLMPSGRTLPFEVGARLAWAEMRGSKEEVPVFNHLSLSKKALQ